MLNVVNWRFYVINVKELFVLNVFYSLIYNIYLIVVSELLSVYNFVYVFF